MRQRQLLQEIVDGLIDPMIGLPGLSWVMATYGAAASSSAQADNAHWDLFETDNKTFGELIRPSRTAICFDKPVDNTALDYRSC